MRVAVISAFVAALGLICIANPAEAQSRQNAAASHVSLRPETPLANTTPSVTITPSHANSAYVLPSNVVQGSQLSNHQAKQLKPFGDHRWHIPRPNERLQAKALPPAGTCAHILIHHVQSPDSSSMIRELKGTADRMPTMKGLPPCRQDAR